MHVCTCMHKNWESRNRAKNYNEKKHKQCHLHVCLCKHANIYLPGGLFDFVSVEGSKTSIE